MRHSARADINPITMEAGVLEYHLGSLSNLLLSSPRKESSICMEFCDRHQFSVPYRRMGKMQVSTIEQPDRDERSPLKSPKLP